MATGWSLSSARTEPNCCLTLSAPWLTWTMMSSMPLSTATKVLRARSTIFDPGLASQVSFAAGNHLACYTVFDHFTEACPAEVVSSAFIHSLLHVLYGYTWWLCTHSGGALTCLLCIHDACRSQGWCIACSVLKVTACICVISDLQCQEHAAHKV